jgi:hypothetical protein
VPKGNPTAQTKASAKYQAKVGYITKGFKMKKELADEFALACEKAGVSQSSVITNFMREFIEKNK